MNSVQDYQRASIGLQVADDRIFLYLSLQANSIGNLDQAFASTPEGRRGAERLIRNFSEKKFELFGQQNEEGSREGDAVSIKIRISRRG